MNNSEILTRYLFPVMLQIIVVALVAGIFRKKKIETGYQSVLGIVLIVLGSISSALWGTLYQYRYNQKSFLDIIRDFFDVRQSMMSYLLVMMFLLIIFGGTKVSKEFHGKKMWAPVLLFLQALAVGGIEEIGWRYTFQPVMEQMVTYIPAVFITFICWGIWHILFFYIDGSLKSINIPLFLLGLLNNSFVLSALYAYSGSLWICVMTHALTNAFSPIAEDKNVRIGIIKKIICMIVAVGLYSVTSQ